MAEHGLAERFVAHLFASGLVDPGQTVLVALSGGLDSVALLHLLRFAVAPGMLRLRAAHFDHRMRPDSAADARWVAGLCRAWEVEATFGLATRPLVSEAEAREARYAFLLEAARASGAERILTAHHADDQAETVLLRILRGTGTAGLAGILPRRGPIVRPLLPFRRAEIEAYARAHGLRWREDRTNLDRRFLRNRLRHDVLPLLENAAPGASTALARLADRARRDEAAWEAALDALERDVVLRRDDRFIELARPRLLSYDAGLQARMLRRWLRRLGSLPGRVGTRAATKFITSGSSGAELHLPGGVRLEREFDRIRLRRADASPAVGAEPALRIEEPGTGAGEVRIGGHAYAARWRVAGEGEGEAFDLEALRFPLELRGWRAGDRIRLDYGSKKLKKLFLERRVGRLDRTRLPVLAEVEGRVLWIPELARAAVAQPLPGRPRFLITVRDAEHTGR